MTTRRLAMGALLLWGVTVAAVGYLFINGTVSPATDERTAIILDSGERNLVLGEMRTMLASVQGIVAGLSDEDLQRVQRSARASGMAIAQDVPPTVMTKLPLDFKQMGMGVHRGFDEISVAVGQEEAPEMIMARLGDQLGRCIACHARYRIDTAGERR